MGYCKVRVKGLGLAYNGLQAKLDYQLIMDYVKHASTSPMKNVF